MKERSLGRSLTTTPVSPLLRVDFHCHTIYSHDSLISLQALLTTCRRRGIDRVAITDHNTIAGALQAREMDPERVIVGEEILTEGMGELLAFFLREQVPSGLSPRETIAHLREQGAFISVSHPFDRMRNGWSLPVLMEIAPLVDAIETFNARCLWSSFNARALAFAQEHGLPGTAGSDAHAAFEVGRSTLVLPFFNDAASLKTVLNHSRRQGKLSMPWVHLASRWAAWQKRLSVKRND